MPLQDALRFLQVIRHEQVRLARLRATPPEDLPTAMTRLGAELGCMFTLDEMQVAFARDSAMRQLRYAPPVHTPDTRAPHVNPPSAGMS